MKFTISHSERYFPIYIVKIAFHFPDAETRAAVVTVIEDEFLLEQEDKTIPSIAYNKLCKGLGVNKGSIIVETYTVDIIKTQYFIA